MRTLLVHELHLTALQGSTVAFLDSVETSRGLRVGARVGRMMPAHCTAAGKAILAHLPSDELRRIYSEQKLEPMTSRSLTSMADLEAQLEQVRERGYATNFGESESDVAPSRSRFPNVPEIAACRSPSPRRSGA